MWRTTQTLVKCTGQTISDFGSGVSHGRGALGSEGMAFPIQDSRNDGIRGKGDSISSLSSLLMRKGMQRQVLTLDN